MSTSVLGRSRRVKLGLVQSFGDQVSQSRTAIGVAALLDLPVVISAECVFDGSAT